MKIFIFLLSVVFIFGFGIKICSADSIGKEGSFLIEEKITFKNLPEDLNSLRIWIPYPVNDARQLIDNLNLVSQFDSHLIIDKEYGNTIIYLEPKQNFLDKSVPRISLSFEIKRKESSVYSDPHPDYKILSRFLKGDRLVPVSGKIKTLAKQITKGKSTNLEKVRAIYDYVINELTYARDNPKICGIGNSLLTLKFKKGICTDYHSLFISLVRSLGIPAKFEVGFLIPDNKQEGKLSSYHCWAEFYLKDKGWIPVDVSEADKHPKMKDYYFGHIDAQRIHLSTGRDIRLEYAKNREPLNFFVYPYAEINGTQFTDIDFELFFREMRGGG